VEITGDLRLPQGYKIIVHVLTFFLGCFLWQCRCDWE